MDGINLSQTGPDAPVGALLARARRARRVSQLDLAVEAGISPRHLSFVETGRARPSRGLVLRLCEALGVSPRDTDAFLLAAGFAPAHRETPLEAPAMAEVLAALRLLLGKHPWPGAAFDARWDLVMANEGYAAAVDACLADGLDPALGTGPIPRLALLPQPRLNMLRLLCHPQGARKRLANWPEVTRALLERVSREARNITDPARRPPLEEALAWPGVARLLRGERPAPAAALVVPVEFLLPGGGTARFLTTIATLGTAQDLTLRELRIETYHPAEA